MNEDKPEQLTQHLNIYLGYLETNPLILWNLLKAGCLTLGHQLFDEDGDQTVVSGREESCPWKLSSVDTDAETYQDSTKIQQMKDIRLPQ